MHAHRTTKAPPARAMAMRVMDRSREEALLLDRWAASDSARIMDDTDWDESMDQLDMASIAPPRHGYDS